MIWPPSNAISIRMRSLLLTGDHLREDAVDGVWVDERDLEAEQSRPRRVVDQVGAEEARIGRERLVEILDGDAEVMDAPRPHDREAIAAPTPRRRRLGACLP